MSVLDAMLQQFLNLVFFAIRPEQPSVEPAMLPSLCWWGARKKPVLFLSEYIFQINVPDVLHLLGIKDVIHGKVLVCEEAIPNPQKLKRRFAQLAMISVIFRMSA